MQGCLYYVYRILRWAGLIIKMKVWGYRELV